MTISNAMVLAAGFGKRMLPLTNKRPKALIELCGVSLLDRAIARCREAGVSKVIVNSHYLAPMIHHHLRDIDNIVLSHEKKVLETGGGVRKALPLLGKTPFYVINCDSVWTERKTPVLRRLAAGWNDNEMDALLLLQPIKNTPGHSGKGDFSRDQSGRLRRASDGSNAPLVFMGVQILHPRLFENLPIKQYSLNLVYDRAISDGRLFGVVHNGSWFHVGTPGELAEAERLILKEGCEPKT